MTDQEVLRKYFAQECKFVMGAQDYDSIPILGELPEFVFLGRSNVGKSSLINSLVNQKALARTSKTPGRTQQINFFALGKQLLLVDVPGYGFAKVSQKERNSWGKLILDYLRGRAELKRAFVLIDARVGIKEIDQELFALLDEQALSYQIIFTKTDKAPQSDLEKYKPLLKKYTALHPDIILTSALKKSGIIALQETIYNLATR